MLPVKTFRKMALGFDGAVESAHMGHPDFRANGKIFATIQTAERAMVKLTPEQQRTFIADFPGAFMMESGAWGRSGCTRVLLAAADEEPVGEAMTLAYQNVMAAKPGRSAKAKKKR
jgi:hypothetical protein